MPNQVKQLMKQSAPTLLEERIEKDGRQSEERRIRDYQPSPVNPLAVEHSLIIFDWDDTFLPTSALERARLLQIPLQQRLRPQLQQQLTDLASLCIDVLNHAQKFGKVIIVTNSAPGWLDSSCQTFMPTLHSKIRQFPIYAKPMNYSLTYKLDVFQREIGIGANPNAPSVGKQYLNLVSVGDGIAERTGTLRLVGSTSQQHGGVQRCLKSVKFKDLPTIGQLFEQLELLLTRLDHVANYNGDLDLRSNFTQMRSSVLSPSSQNNGSCAFVHLTQLGDRRGPSGGNTSSQKVPSLPSTTSFSDDVNANRGNTRSTTALSGSYSAAGSLSRALGSDSMPGFRGVSTANSDDKSDSERILDRLLGLKGRSMPSPSLQRPVSQSQARWP